MTPPGGLVAQTYGYLSRTGGQPVNQLTIERTGEHFRVTPARLQKLWWDGWITATGKDDRGMPIFAESPSIS